MINALVLGLLMQLPAAETDPGPRTAAAPGDKVVISRIIIQGNKKTKPFIILRELQFNPGDSVELSELAGILVQCRNNLMNTSLFNSVEITAVQDSFPNADIRIKVAERWYLWPQPIFELADRNFNQWYLNKDFRRTNYGINLSKYNFLGRNQTVNIILQHGYTRQYGLIYNIPYINKQNTLGITMTAGYAVNHEVPYLTISDSLQFMRFENEYALRHFNSSVSFNYRPRLYNVFKISLNYGKVKVIDDVAQRLNPDFLLDSQTTQEAVGIKFTHINDRRDSRSYPLRGTYSKLELWGTGLGLSKDVNIGGFYAMLGRYAKLARRTYMAAGLRSKISFPQRQPYFNNKALGYDDYVRGYEYYVIDGPAYMLVKAALKYNFFPLKYFHLKFVPFQQFNKVPISAFAGLFIDAGYVANKYTTAGNELTNTLLAGGGVAIDITTYYDKTARIEFSYNKLKQFGVFLHFVLPI